MARRRYAQRRLSDDDVELLEIADELDAAGDGVRAAFIRGLVERRRCDMLDVLGVRRWLRRVDVAEAGGVDSAVLARLDAEGRRAVRSNW